MDNSPQGHEIVESYFFRVSFLPLPPRDSLSEWLEEEVDLLKCESNSRSLWLKNKLEMDRGAIARIKDMQNNAEQDLTLMTGKLKFAEAEAVELSEKLKEKEIPKN